MKSFVLPKLAFFHDVMRSELELFSLHFQGRAKMLVWSP